MKSKNNKKKVLIFLAILILLVGGGFYLYKSVLSKDKTEEKKQKTPEKEVSLDLFGEYYNKAEELMEKMSLEEKVGQVFFVRFNDYVEEEIKKYYPAGYILFGKDFANETKESIKDKLISLQKLSKTPLAIGTDEEGGIVTRVSRYPEFRSEKFLSPQDIFEKGGYDLLKETELEKAKLLSDLGININLAPVADVSTNPDDYIHSRSFGKSAEETATYITNMVNYANESGISSCLKHFPGYGNNADTHTGVAIDERSIESFYENDFLPFTAGINANVPTIMVSHNLVKSIDTEYPASLSFNVHKILREELGFTGVIMTDDLAMDAVKSYVADGDAATLAINSGNDLIITSDFSTMYNELIANINNNKIKEETLNTAVKRVLAWKLAYGLYK